MLHAKNYQNQPIFHGVIPKIKVAHLFWRHDVN